MIHWILFILIWITNAKYEQDKITSLPYYQGSKLNFDCYSGYLKALSGTFFYFFAESSRNPSKDPLVLWLNGGPGCSSLLGAFTELGPFHPFDDGKNLEYNPYSWNGLANIIFLESPACVGYSYPNTQSCNEYFTDDNQTAYDNYYALQSFFKKFPEYINRDFYIAGESYAGHYIPQLASRIIIENERIDQGMSKNVKIILKAIAVGNPYVQRDANFFQGWLPSMYDFGIINDEQYNYLISGNCSSLQLTKECANKVWTFIDTYLWYDINAYDVNVDHNCSTRSRQRDALLRNVHKSYQFEQNLENGNIWAYPYASCDDNNLVTFLNSDTTKKALHVATNKVNRAWDYCAFSWHGYDVNSTDDAVDQVRYYRNVLRNGIRVLIYSGNVDLVVAYSATRYWIYNTDYLGNDTNSTGEVKTDWHSWHVNGEVGGWMQVWQNLAFAVVRDAGHEVPEYQPERAFSLFDRFLRNDYNDTPLDLSAYQNNFAEYGGDSNTNNVFWIGLQIGIASGIGAVGLISLGIFLWRYYRKQKLSHMLALRDELA